jgi:hypothetical protein
MSKINWTDFGGIFPRTVKKQAKTTRKARLLGDAWKSFDGSGKFVFEPTNSRTYDGTYTVTNPEVLGFDQTGIEASGVLVIADPVTKTARIIRQ